MRVPSPAARTTTASSELKAGAPGFEPGIAGPKPAALPLGYAPLHFAFYPSLCVRRSYEQSPCASRSLSQAMPQHLATPQSGPSLAPVREKEENRDEGEDAGQEQREPAEDEGQNDDDDRESL